MSDVLLDFHTRQELARKTFELAEPIYRKMQEAWPDVFETMASYEQDTLILSINGYSRFIDYLKTAFNNVSIPVSTIINYRSSLVLNFDSSILGSLERDLFCAQLLSSNGEGMPGLLGLTASAANPSLVTEATNTVRRFDVLAAYLFLYNIKFFVYGMNVKLYPEDKEK